MELDGKAIASAVLAAVVGGGSGFATVQVDVARIEARLAGMEAAFRDRVVEAQQDHQQTRDLVHSGLDAVNDRVSIAVEAIQGRLDRLDERKMDK